MWGYKHTLETKQKISETQRGRTVSLETRRKISETLRGRKRPELTGEKHPMWGKKHSPETKRKMSGENHPQWGKRGKETPGWKGGKRISVDGRVFLLRPDHPHPQKSGYVAHSRLVMEKHLGRYLEPWEIVHHKGDIDDDRIEMLLLFPSNAKHLKHHARLRRARRAE